MAQPRKGRGQAMVELALILPIFLTLLFGIIDFSYYMFVSVSLSHGTRAGVRRAAMNNKTREEIKGIVVASCPGINLTSFNVQVTISASDSTRPNRPPTVQVETRVQHKFFCSGIVPVSDLLVKSVIKCSIVTTPQIPAITFNGCATSHTGPAHTGAPW